MIGNFPAQEDVIDLRSRNDKFNQTLNAALLELTIQPENAIVSLARLDTEVITLEALEIAYLENQIANATKKYTEYRLSIQSSLAEAEFRLGHFQEARSAILTARAIPDIRMDSPTISYLDTLEATINRMVPEDIATGAPTLNDKFADLYQDAVRRGNWRGATQAKMDAALTAQIDHQGEAYQTLIQEAIQLAAEHKLIFKAIHCRISRLQYLLRHGKSDLAFDEIVNEIGDDINHLTGPLPKYWEESHNQVFDTCILAEKTLHDVLSGNTCYSVLAEVLKTLSDQALQLDWHVLSGRLQDAAGSSSTGPDTISSLIDTARQELARLDVNIRSKLCKLGTEITTRLNDPDTAEKIRDESNPFR